MMLKSGYALFDHQRRLAARLAGRVGAGEAEDLASEAVARSLARPAPDGRQAPWLETIFRNLLADRGRRWGRRAAAADCAGSVQTPEDLVLAAERARAVTRALPAMPPDLREALEARFFAELDYHQMAAGRGITPTTARTRVHRGLARLRRVLAGVRAMFPAGPGAPVVGTLAPAVMVALLVAAPPVATAPANDAPSPPALRTSEQGPQRSVASNDRPATAPSRPPTEHATVRRAKPAPLRQDDAPAAVERMDFDEDQVEGDLQRPGIMLIDGDPRERRVGSLIEIPRSFEPSMTKMIEDL